MVEIVFTKDYATKKKGDVFACDSMLARRLISQKVAKKYTKKEPEKDKTK